MDGRRQKGHNESAIRGVRFLRMAYEVRRSARAFPYRQGLQRLRRGEGHDTGHGCIDRREKPRLDRATRRNFPDRARLTVLQAPELVRRLAQTAGLRVREQDVEALARWSAERVRELGLPGVERYGQLLAEDSAAGQRERERLTVRSTTGESYFFRDPGQFDLIATVLLPQLIARRADARSLRLWSAGCAAGEEAYSLAMLVDELAPRLAGWNVLILGTDINGEALDRARLGVYGDWSFRALNPPRKRRYFQPVGDQWRIAPQLRDRVSFRRVDLVRDRFPDPGAGLHQFDLILCRNVFIYLDAHAIGHVTGKLAAALAEDGCLVTGHNELFGHDTAPLHLHLFAQSAVFRKTTQPPVETGPAPPAASLPAIAAWFPAAETEAPAPRAAPAAPSPLPAAAPPRDCDRLMQDAQRDADGGRPDAAEQDCRAAIALAAMDPRPYFLLAQLAQERGDTAEAKTLLDKVIYLDPSFIAAYLDLGSLCAQDGNAGRARRLYETARAAVAGLPASTVVAPYGESTAADVLAYVERLLEWHGIATGDGAAAAPQPRA